MLDRMATESPRNEPKRLEEKIAISLALCLTASVIEFASAADQ
jgi:hypothetical protein